MVGHDGEEFLVALRIPNPIRTTTPEAGALQAALGSLAFGGPSPIDIENREAQAAQRQAHALLYEEQTRKARAEAEAQVQMNDLRSTAGLNRTAGYRAGLPDTGVRTAEDYFAGRSSEAGTMPPAGPLLDKYADAQFALRTGMADKSVNPYEIERSLQLRGAGRRADDIRTGTLDPLTEAQAVFAQSGKAPFNNTANGTMNVLTGAETINPVGDAAILLKKAQAGKEGAHAGLYSAQGEEQRAVNRAGVGGRFGPPVIVNDQEAGEIYTAPGATAGRAPGAKPKPALSPQEAALKEAQALLAEERARLAGVQADGGGFRPPPAARGGAPRRITANDRTLLDNAIKTTLAEMNVGGLDDATQNAVLAAAEREWQGGAPGHQSAAMAAINAVAPQGFEDGRAGIPLVPSKFRAKGGAQVAPPAAGGAGAPAAPASAPPVRGVQAEVAEARRAIASGKDPAAVRARFKQRTGQDLTD